MEINSHTRNDDHPSRGGAQVLSPQVVQTATTQQFSSDPTLPGLGYVWWIGEQNGVKFVEHDGNLPGFNNRVRLYMDQGVGLVHGLPMTALCCAPVLLCSVCPCPFVHLCCVSHHSSSLLRCSAVDRSC